MESEVFVRWRTEQLQAGLAVLTGLLVISYVILYDVICDRVLGKFS